MVPYIQTYIHTYKHIQAVEEMDVAFDSLQLADQTKTKLTAIHDILTKDRGTLLEILLTNFKGW
jgi:hypothetical protein